MQGSLDYTEGWTANLHIADQSESEHKYEKHFQTPPKKNWDIFLR
jgi:hypothetical protein